MSRQIEMICLEELVPDSHIYRKFKELWNFSEMEKEMRKIEANSDHKGFGIFRLFMCLLIQFMEDLSDRELETYIQRQQPC